MCRRIHAVVHGVTETRTGDDNASGAGCSGTLQCFARYGLRNQADADSRCGRADGRGYGIIRSRKCYGDVTDDTVVGPYWCFRIVVMTLSAVSPNSVIGDIAEG